MKIIQVNCVYKNGSTGKIVYDIHTELCERGVDSAVCYGRGEKAVESNVYKTSSELTGKLNNAYSRFTGVLYGGCLTATHKLIRIIKKEQPDIVHLHCLNGFFVNIYSLLKWLGKNNIKTVLTQHAEFMYTGSCGYSLDCEAWKSGGCKSCPIWKAETRSVVGDKTAKAFNRMRAAFAEFKSENLRVVSVSPWLEGRARQSVILGSFSHQTVFNGIDTDVFCRSDSERETCYPEANGKAVIFHATAMFSDDKDHIKGGHYLLKLAEQMKDKPVHFYIAGTHAAEIKVPENVTLLGRVENQKKLAEYYSLADITLLTSKRETFSMICAESLCCGTPVVGFFAGAPETISIPEYSSFVEFGDVDVLENAVEAMLARSHSADEISSAAKALYSKRRMTDEYLKIYDELLAEGRSQ